VATQILSVPDWTKARVQQANTRPRCQIHTCRNLGRHTATTKCGCGEASIHVCRKHHTEVFSTDWSFGAGQDERCFGDGADSLRAQSDAVERLPAGLEQRDAAFALGA
jgi:hypothetical protein